ncbi:LppA family lipoprotein [Nocardia sp. XZ_19_385]|uniref:LppA family lipoprotein n=1 Tax=Nocardia sp. XZ_19_385 TaxID=2769488 RepID=UPI00188EA59C|nr:LppA family lipoprotein [Nocardia sp. XZ_19_385]
MTRNRMRLIIALTLVAGVIMMILLAIGLYRMTENPYEPSSDDETAAAAQQLQQRSSMEDATAEINGVVEQIAAAASELVPGLRFYWNREESTTRCGRPFDRTNGLKRTLRNYVASAPIPDEVWPTLVGRVNEIVAKVGASNPAVMQDINSVPGTPGNHDIWFSNPDIGTVIKVGSQKATVISATTGCHLKRADFANPIREK